MPSKRAHFRGSRAGSVRARIGRFAGTLLVVGVGLFALLLLAVRFVVFPQVESHRDTLAAMLSQQLGRPVEIAVLATGWDGWNPKLVVEGFRVLDRERAGATPLLELPVVELVLAWTSLPLMELRLKELIVERPRLSIRRDRAGMLHIAGIEIDPTQAPEDANFAEWFLRQRQIVVRDALIIWNDDLRNAPQLVLDRVQFRLQRRFGHHRFGLTGAPPTEISAPIDVRGDLRDLTSGDWQRARGSLYVRLDYADVAAWREWLPLPIPIASGKGAMRVWLDLGEHEVREIVADLELAEVSAQVDDRLPPLELAHLRGRVGWRSAVGRQEFFTRSLELETRDGQRLGPATLSLATNDAAGGKPASGRLDFDRLELAPLRDLAANLPLAAGLRADLARFAPRGTLQHASLGWEGAFDAPETISASAEFSDLGVAPQEAIPGVAGAAGRLEFTRDKGELRVSARDVQIAAPRALAEPLALDSVEAIVNWEHKPDATTVRVQKLEFASRALTGNAAGTYRTANGGVDQVDVNAQVARIDVAQLHHFVPVAAAPGLGDWMRTALVQGALVDVRLKLAGNPADLPWNGGKKGQFLFTAKAKDVALEYAPRWPGIAGIDGDLRVDGARLTIDIARGHIFGAVLGKTRMEIADLAAEGPLLRIDGTASGPATDFLRFVKASPVAEWIDHLTDDAEGAGSGRLTLNLGLALGRPGQSKVTGEFTLAQGQLRLPQLPALAQINGTLSFSEVEVRARDVSAEVLGGPAKLTLASSAGRVRLTAAGSAPLTQVRREFAYPFLDRLSGTIDWTMGMNLRPELSWVLESTLRGVAMDLPAPFGKTAAETRSLRIERRGDGAKADEDFILASYGRAATFAAHRKHGTAGIAIDRALLSLGRATERPDATRAERPGIWLRADLGALDLDEWLALARRGTPAQPGSGVADVTFAGMDLRVGELDVFGVRLTGLDIAARRSREGWSLDLKGDELAGTATWAGPGSDAPAGRISARLAKFGLPGISDMGPRPGSEPKLRAPEPRGEAAVDAAWPELDIVAESLSSRSRDLGRLELRAQPRGGEWKIERLALTNDNGRIEAGGEWRVLGQEQKTRLDVSLDVKEAGAFLARYGYAEALSGAPTKIAGNLAWAGTPLGFDFPTLSGAFRIDVGAGRFTRVEPGVGKLVGVLSLQALPRRVTLDFRDIFSEGFTFDEVTGSVAIASGVMSTNNLRLVGPAAQVMIAGDADLARETQRIAVRVQPALSGGVSAGAALLFFANPLVGAAVGAGSLLAQKILKDPIEQMFTFEYLVTGSWSDPVVTRSGSATASVAPGTPGRPAGATP